MTQRQIRGYIFILPLLFMFITLFITLFSQYLQNKKLIQQHKEFIIAQTIESEKKSVKTIVDASIAAIESGVASANLDFEQEKDMITHRVNAMSKLSLDNPVFVYSTSKDRVSLITQPFDSSSAVSQQIADDLKKIYEDGWSFSHSKDSIIKSSTYDEPVSYFRYLSGYEWVIGKAFDVEGIYSTIEQKMQTFEKKLSSSFMKTVIQSLAFFGLFASILYYVLQKLLHFIEKNQEQLYTQSQKAQNMGRKYEAIFASLQDGNLIVAQQDLRVSEANNRIKQMLKVQDGSLIKREFFSLVKDRSLFKRVFDELLSKQERIFLREVVLEADDGTYVYADCVVSKFVYENRVYIAVVFHDLSKRLEYVKELEQVRQRLFHANLDLKERVKKEVNKSRKKDSVMFEQSKLAMLGEVINSIAHQWRQPLNRLSAVVNNLKIKSQLQQLDRVNITESIDLMNSNIQNMSSSIDKFRIFFAMDSEKRVFELQKEIEKAINFAKQAHGFETIKITQTFYPKDCMVYGYASELRQMVLNFLNNAKEAFSNVSRDEKKIDLKVSVVKHNVVVTIIDNAGGIKPELLEYIYDPYFTTKKNSSGVGIGLFMAKTIIKKHFNGTIDIQNYEDGLCVSFTVALYEN